MKDDALRTVAIAASLAAAAFIVAWVLKNGSGAAVDKLRGALPKRASSGFDYEDFSGGKPY